MSSLAARSISASMYLTVSIGSSVTAISSATILLPALHFSMAPPAVTSPKHARSMSGW